MLAWFNRLKSFDLPLLVTTLLLVGAGLIVLYSTSLSNSDLGIFYRQLVVAVIGLGAVWMVSLYNYQRIAKINRWFFVLTVISLLIVLFFGRAAKGSSRWIDFGFFQFQPAELAKLIVVIGLARLFYLRRGQINTVTNVFISLLYVLIPGILIARQPDLGSTMVLMAIWVGMLFVSPIKKKYLVIILVLGLAFTGISWKYLLHDYQRHRVEVFLNPGLDPQGKGYNVKQAIIAVGSGQWLGRGLGQGIQSSLKFLPERQTDFVFASMAEEVGLLGSTAVVMLLLVLLWRITVVMNLAKDDLGYYICAGIFWMFFIQILINVGMNMGIMPVTGIPLPFISYGRSALLVQLIAIGMVQNVAMQSKVSRF